MPDLIRHPEVLEKIGCARSLRSLRLPSVARLESIPMKIGAGMTPLHLISNSILPCLGLTVSYVSKVVLEAVLEIFHNILLAVDDKDMVLDMEEFPDQPFHRIECL